MWGVGFIGGSLDLRLQTPPKALASRGCSQDTRFLGKDLHLQKVMVWEQLSYFLLFGFSVKARTYHQPPNICSCFSYGLLVVVLFEDGSWFESYLDPKSR